MQSTYEFFNHYKSDPPTSEAISERMRNIVVDRKKLIRNKAMTWLGVFGALICIFIVGLVNDRAIIYLPVFLITIAYVCGTVSLLSIIESDDTSFSEKELLPADADLLARLDKELSDIPEYFLAIGKQGRPITYAEARYFSLQLTGQRMEKERLMQEQQRINLNSKLTCNFQ